ncbi:hypothetical protein OAA00_09455 [Cyclobacteriaceae bacterium]|nr:hypothetical protein [Cyclobacteriaceae bacterium]MDB4316460.1 hypothetical protein [Cyclobacteriaceae bacterium]
MSKITLSTFILLILTSCATSKFDFATAYKFNTIRKYPSLGEKNLKVLASPEQTLPNHLSQSKSKIVETASLKSVTVASEDIIHSKLSTYEKLDNISRKDTRRNNKLNKIITRLGDIKFDTIITESGLVVPLLEKEETTEERKKSYWTIASALTLFIPSVGLLISTILAFVGYKRGERGAKVLLIINAVVWVIQIFLLIRLLILFGNYIP